MPQLQYACVICFCQTRSSVSSWSRVRLGLGQVCLCFSLFFVTCDAVVPLCLSVNVRRTPGPCVLPEKELRKYVFQQYIVTPMLENTAGPLFRENKYGSVITVSTRSQSRKFHGSCSLKSGAETVLDGETCFSPRDEKRVLKLSGKWFHSGKPLTSGTFEMYWDFTTRTMQGVRSEGNITTKWLWTGLDGALDWVSQIFHTDSVPMPKMLPDNFCLRSVCTSHLL